MTMINASTVPIVSKDISKQSKGISPASQPWCWHLWGVPTVQMVPKPEWMPLTQLVIDDRHLKFQTVLKLLINYHSNGWVGKGVRELLTQRIWQEVTGTSYSPTSTSSGTLCACRVLLKSPWLIHTVNNKSFGWKKYRSHSIFPSLPMELGHQSAWTHKDSKPLLIILFGW